MIQSHAFTQVMDWIQSDSTTLLFVSSTTCSVCVAVGQKLEILEQFHGKTRFVSAKLEELPELSGSLLVFTVPTVLVFREGKEIHRQSRFFRWDLLEGALEESVQEKRPYE